MKRVAALFLACALAAPAAAQAAVGSTGESWRLFRGLAERPRVALTVPSGPCEHAAARLVEVLAARGLVAELDPEGSRSDAVRVLAGAAGDPELEPLARAVGVELIAGGFHLLGRDFTANGDALVAVFEDPEHPGRPLCLFLGNDMEELAVYLDDLPRLTVPRVFAWVDGEPALACPLALDGTPRAEELVDHAARREAYFAGTVPVALPGVDFRARVSPDRARVQAYGKALAGAYGRVTQWLGAEELPRAELFLYEHLEDFEQCLGIADVSLANRLRPRVHVLLAPGVPDDGGAGLVRVLAREAAGEPAEPWLADALAVAASGRWWQQPLDEWLVHLARGKLLPPIEELLAIDAEARWSPHVLAPARALVLSRALMAGGGDPRRALAMWKGAGLEAPKLGALYQRGVLDLMRVAADTTDGAGAQRMRGRADRVAGAPFRHGIALVEAPHAGYGTRALDAAIAEARALAPPPDSVSLTVLASAVNGLAEAGATPGLAASVSDLGLASACAAARAADMRILLSLEVLASASGAWADVRSWTEPDALERFFAEYRRVALHYALVAELLRVELYSFGSNLTMSLRTEPNAEVKDPARLAALRLGWKELATTMRAAYGGGITCTSRLPEAYEVGIFGDVDFIGLSLWPRLARVGAPDDSELRRALRYDVQEALDLAVRWNKPLVLVQVGFPARSLAWGRPSVPNGVEDPFAQVRFHEALADVLTGRLENGAGLRGFYLWSWSTGPAGANGGFSLRGSAALSTLERLFAR